MTQFKTRRGILNKRNRVAYSRKQTPPYSGHLWKIIYHDKLITVAEIADIVGKATKTINNWAEGRGKPSVEQLRLLYEETGIVEFIEYFLPESAPHILIERPEGNLDDQTLLMKQLNIGEAYGEFLTDIREALEDGKLSRSELRRIKWSLSGMQKEVAELEANLEKVLK